MTTVPDNDPYHLGSDYERADIASDDTLRTAGDLLRALASPVRIAIVLLLHQSDRCVHELVSAVGVPQPLVSQHLRVLKSAGVVIGTRRGREVTYTLTDHHVAHIVNDAVAHAAEDAPAETTVFANTVEEVR